MKGHIIVTDGEHFGAVRFFRFTYATVIENLDPAIKMGGGHSINFVSNCVLYDINRATLKFSRVTIDY